MDQRTVGSLAAALAAAAPSQVVLFYRRFRDRPAELRQAVITDIQRRDHRVAIRFRGTSILPEFTSEGYGTWAGSLLDDTPLVTGLVDILRIAKYDPPSHPGMVGDQPMC